MKAPLEPWSRIINRTQTLHLTKEIPVYSPLRVMVILDFLTLGSLSRTQSWTMRKWMNPLTLGKQVFSIFFLCSHLSLAILKAHHGGEKRWRLSNRQTATYRQEQKSITTNIALTKTERQNKRWVYSLELGFSQWVVCFLLNGISTFVSYLMSKPSLLRDSRDTISPIAGGLYQIIVFHRWFSRIASALNEVSSLKIGGWFKFHWELTFCYFWSTLFLIISWQLDRIIIKSK